MKDRITEIGIKLRTGQAITHEDAADLFELTSIGAAVMRRNNLTRADILARLRLKFPDAAELTEKCRAMIADFEARDRLGMH